MKTVHKLVFAALCLNFWIPVLIYVFDPAGAIGQFAALGDWLGAPPYPHTEDSIFWRVLGIANVATLGFGCFLLMLDAKRWQGVVLPIAFLKAMATVGWMVAWLVEGMPQYLAAGLFDALTVAAIVGFGHAGARALEAEDPPAATLQPAK